MRQRGFPKLWYPTSALHGATTQNTSTEKLPYLFNVSAPYSSFICMDTVSAETQHRVTRTGFCNCDSCPLRYWHGAMLSLWWYLNILNCMPGVESFSQNRESAELYSSRKACLLPPVSSTSQGNCVAQSVRRLATGSISVFSTTTVSRQAPVSI